MLAIRALPATLGLSLVALAVIGPLSVEGPRRADAVSPARVATAPVGSRVTLLGLVTDVRKFPDGGAATALSDCLGASADVYFPPGVEPPPDWTVALIGGAVQLYAGRVEVRADSVTGALGPGEGAEQVTAEELLQDPARFACRPVAFQATVRSTTAADGQAGAHLLVEAGNGTIGCEVHLRAPAAVHVLPGTRVTLIGVAAVRPDGSPTVHVRA